MAKQHRPIDIYEKQFEDPLIDSSEDIREDIKENPVEENFNLLQHVSTKTTLDAMEPIPESQKESYQQFIKDTPQRERVEKLEEGGLDGLGVPGLQPGADDITAYSTTAGISDNWWNTMYNMIDNIDDERYKGQILEAETEIEKIQEAIALGEGKLSADDLETLKEEEKDWQEQITDAQEDIIANQHDMRDQKVAKYYEDYTHLMEQQEGSSFMSYMGHMIPFVDSSHTSGEMAKDIGGAFSDITAMGISIVAPMVTTAAANAVIAAVSAGGAAGSVTGPGALVTGAIAGAGTILGIGISGYAQWYQRDHESYAEMYGAYDERLGDLKKKFLFDNRRQPTPEELKEMEGAARKGASTVYDQNKALMLYDVAEVGSYCNTLG